MDHLGAGVGLLEVVGHGDRVELAARVVAAQHHAGVLPGDGRAGLDLRPGDVRARAFAQAALGDEVVDATTPCSSPGYQFCTVEYLMKRVVVRDQLHHRGVQLVLVALRRGAAFEVADVAAFLGNDQRALELPGVCALMRKYDDSSIGQRTPLGM
jgi:hypothetical protein